jgi:CRISPR-associated exonuclease Cas4
MFTEDQLIPISALQHWVFCPRQCGLIHLEQMWAENRLTAEGRLLHDRVHEADAENRPGIRIVRGLRLVSYRLGLVGQADVVEFHQSDNGIALPGASGLWRPLPVEYKRGKPKKDNSDNIQLCAQALCLEEMLHTDIPVGAFFYGKPRRRTEVQLDDLLRELTCRSLEAVRRMLESSQTPTVRYSKIRYSKKCDRCSLYAQCLPKTTGLRKKIDVYLARAFEPDPMEDVP